MGEQELVSECTSLCVSIATCIFSEELSWLAVSSFQLYSVCTKSLRTLTLQNRMSTLHSGSCSTM